MQQITKTYDKIQIYWWYFWEYLRYIDFRSISNALRYVISKKSNSTDRLIYSRMGVFLCRKDTTDFMYANYNYERKVKKFIRKNLSKYDTFLDVGACIGDYSVWLANNGYKCLTFEPVPANFEVLQQNIKINHLTEHIHSYPWGLGSKKEEVSFEVRPHNKGASKVIRNNHIPETSQTNNGQIQQFDSIVNQLPLSHNDKVIIKLDVEGMESEVLKGASEFIKNCPHLMLIMETCISDQQALKQLLAQWGEFKYTKIDEHNFAATKQV
ncbi:FkbM family methyltransferase [uncultured Microscilla sp.]|uniref:FkbM family methyltransferase n=1 Tax=uncultured Microscilla sp. TaxID=432653 RepID=UPI002624D46A|nr:FkbM family methyltransferase [uncultured Microscilla sp.]